MTNNSISTTLSETSINIAKAATGFLQTLPDHQLVQARLDFFSHERSIWDYTPNIVRKGIPIKDMDSRQINAAELLMVNTLSPIGLEKAKSIMRHESILRIIERENGYTRFSRNPGEYFFSIFGNPTEDHPWGWRLDGHHLCLNITVVDKNVVSVTPIFFGSNPGEVRHGPHKGLRILKDEEDLGRRLFLSLGTRLKQYAILYPKAPPDLITRSSPRFCIDQPSGVPAELMDNDQKQLLVSLIKVYIEKIDTGLSSHHLSELNRGIIGKTFFGWAGSPHERQGHYYRIHGPSFFAEYDNTQNMANHVHSVWRDTRNDFGFDILKAHYGNSHTG